MYVNEKLETNRMKKQDQEAKRGCNRTEARVIRYDLPVRLN